MTVFPSRQLTPESGMAKRTRTHWMAFEEQHENTIVFPMCFPANRPSTLQIWPELLIVVTPRPRLASFREFATLDACRLTHRQSHRCSPQRRWRRYTNKEGWSIEPLREIGCTCRATTVRRKSRNVSRTTCAIPVHEARGRTSHGPAHC